MNTFPGGSGHHGSRAQAGPVAVPAPTNLRPLARPGPRPHGDRCRPEMYLFIFTKLVCLKNDHHIYRDI